MKNKEIKTIFSSMKDFSSIPPPELWNSIEKKLDKPKRDKRLIFWWSIAASLFMGLSISSIFYFNTNQTDNFSKDAVVNANDNNSNINDKSNNNDNINSDINANSNSNDKSNNNINTNNKGNVHNNINVSKATVSLPFSSKAKVVTILKNSNQSKNNPVLSAAANRNRGQLPLNKKENDTNQNSSASVSKLETLEEKNNSIDNSKSSIVTSKNNGVFGFAKNKDIAESSITKDSLNKIKLEVAKLEKALVTIDEEKNKKIKNTENIDKWSIQVFAGVSNSQNYNNQTTIGNSVDSKQSNGYGVKTNYKLNKKWGVSSGLKINELGQKIMGVSYYGQQSHSGIVSARIPIAKDAFIQSSTKNDYELVSISNNKSYLFASNSAADNGFDSGNVTQNLKYFEMPLEISYSILNKNKTSIIMNSGGFVGKLISNEILLNGTSIGENSNANQYVYGTLLSSTLQYEFYKKTNFFVEPGMNYYINPMENQSFNQFQWVFNLGLSFAF